MPSTRFFTRASPARGPGLLAPAVVVPAPPFRRDAPRPVGRSHRALLFALVVAAAAGAPHSDAAADPFGVEGRVPSVVSAGGIVSLTLRPSPRLQELRASLDGAPMALMPVGRGLAHLLVGIDVEARGRRIVRLEAKDGRGRALAREWPVRVRPQRVAVQRLTVPREMVELDPEAARRVAIERERLEDLWRRVTPERYWRGRFVPPVTVTERPHGFGFRRIINGQNRSPHAGADYAAPLGSGVQASNRGRVALAEEQFFGGNALVLDHGGGLYTIYLHLQESLVRVGEMVDKGQAIGRVGATGRATGPHLHFGVRLQGARVDPAALLRIALP